jgi:2-polyprenyl-3-methyl-5-hydroxy-6-metoxy-1,4-benzoquinol methylase
MKAEAYQIMSDSEESFWWYRVRRQIIADTVQRFVATGSMLLDFGAGHGATASRLCELGYRVVVTDNSEEALHACSERGLETIAPEELATGGYAFDAVLACDVLEHVADDEAVIRLLRNALRPGGLILVTVPAFEFLWSGEDYVSEHVRRYNWRGLARLLDGAGFERMWQSHFNAILFAPVACTILWKRLMKPRDMYSSNVRPLPPWLDYVLGRLFALELHLLGWLRFPLGTSLIAVSRRRGRFEDPTA